MNKKHKLILCLALILLVIGIVLLVIDKSNITQESRDFAYEYNSLNGEKNEYGSYRKINIPENNPFKEVSIDQINDMVDNKESFIVFFGFPECPWCRSMLETFTHMAKRNHIKTIYYVNVKDIRDVQEFKNGQITITKTGSKGYMDLLQKFKNVLSDYTLTNSKNKTIKTGEKRIYAPNVIKVEKGKAVALIDGLSDKQKDSMAKIIWKMKSDMKKEMKEFFKK